MRGAVGLGDPRRERRLSLPSRHFAVSGIRMSRDSDARIKLRLPRPDQIDIHLGK